MSLIFIWGQVSIMTLEYRTQTGEVVLKGKTERSPIRVWLGGLQGPPGPPGLVAWELWDALRGGACPASVHPSQRRARTSRKWCRLSHTSHYFSNFLIYSPPDELWYLLSISCCCVCQQIYKSSSTHSRWIKLVEYKVEKKVGTLQSQIIYQIGH